MYWDMCLDVDCTNCMSRIQVDSFEGRCSECGAKYHVNADMTVDFDYKLCGICNNRINECDCAETRRR